MKKTLHLLYCMMLIMLSSCGNSDEPSTSDIVGNWYGTRQYYNPVGGTKYQYITVTFNENHTGSLDYEAPTSISKAYFSWDISGSTITCRGAYANSDGDTDIDFKMTLEKRGDRLYPLDKYTTFILTRDNSVMTDGDGIETANPEDKLDMLHNVWINTDGYSIVEFFSDGSYDEYILASKNSKSYQSYTTGWYSFTPSSNQLVIDGTSMKVTELSESNLKIVSGQSTLSYRRGTKSDIPTTTDLKSFLTYNNIGWTDKNGDHTLIFTDDIVVYMERSTKKLGSSGYIGLSAKGQYTCSSDKVTCYFNDIYWEQGNGYASDYFPGWTCGGTATKTFGIEVMASGDIRVTLPNGKTVYMSKI